MKVTIRKRPTIHIPVRPVKATRQRKRMALLAKVGLLLDWLCYLADLLPANDPRRPEVIAKIEHWNVQFVLLL